MNDYELSSLRYATYRAAFYRPYAPIFADMTTEEFIEARDPEWIRINREYLMAQLPGAAQ